MYGLLLEQRIPVMETKLASIKEELNNTYKQSNTHSKLDKDEENTLAKKRERIVATLDKIAEDLREYV